jgi:hypothetical protein
MWASLLCNHVDSIPSPCRQNFRNSGIDLVVNEFRLFSRVIPGLARAVLNPACLQLVPIPEETEDETAESEMELYLEECIEIFYDLDALDREEEENKNR